MRKYVDVGIFSGRHIVAEVDGKLCSVIPYADIVNAPTADVVETEKYNELREAFVDFVCSGVHNPAPYCKNRCDECVDDRGWCTYRRCNGFNPDGKGEEQI